MCGIAGIILRDASPERSLLEDMGRKLGHRGPDEHGVYLHDQLGLAHTRLSIIDVAGGHQPLFGPDQQQVLVANGEIYNHVELRESLLADGHRFTSRSDCETIIHAYNQSGDGFIDRLQGMFAFCLYDRGRQQVLLARDRLGIKPLFLYRGPQGVFFASELKALLAVLPGSAELDPAGLEQYLQLQFTAGRQTMFRHIERVLPGEMIRIRLPNLETERHRYWSARSVAPRQLELHEAQAQFDQLMHQVMQQHMRTDVPYGLFLSGGVDSSILLALLQRYHSEPVRTFSVAFPGTGTRDQLSTADELARHYGTRHTLLETDREEMFYRLPYVAWAADELMQDYANLPTALLAETTGKELKVVFTGEGGDEVFAGYGRYRMNALERGVRNLLAPGSGGFRTRGIFRGQWPGRLFGAELGKHAGHWRKVMRSAWSECHADWSAVQRMQYTDISTALADNLLVKVDRMLMGWGVEGRVPFLDHRVVEFGLALPDHLKIHGGQGKFFLRRWASQFLPEQALWQRKRGFHVPVGHWMRDETLERLEPALLKHRAIREWFDGDGIRRLFQRQRRRGDVTRLVWTLFQFAVWFEIMLENRGERPAARQDPLEVIA
jgi:asparagine synthase (glutamine-hydrolysing)